MTTFEILVPAGIVIIIVLLIRIEKNINAIMANEDRRDLESEVRDFMPTLWKEIEFRSRLIPWYRRMKDSSDPKSAKNWHWYSVLKHLREAEGRHFSWKMPSSEIDRLDELSRQFLHDAESLHLITGTESGYLLFYLWDLHFQDPHILCEKDVISFEENLLEMRKKYLRG